MKNVVRLPKEFTRKGETCYFDADGRLITTERLPDGGWVETVDCESPADIVDRWWNGWERRVR